MRIMFIYSLDDTQSISSPLRSWSSIQFGISYISSLLKVNGHQTQLVVLGSNNDLLDSIKILSAKLGEFSPDIICVTAVASQYEFVKQIAGEIKRQWPGVCLVLGGVHATLNPDEAITGPFDVICVGEGEYPILELSCQMEAGVTPHGIANLWLKTSNGRIERNNPRPFLKDIDSLPFPDRAMWSPWIKGQRGDELTVLLGRGCPYDCTYCCNHAIRKVSTGKYVRFRSVDDVIEEIRFLHAEYPTKSKIYFEVESISTNKAWLADLCAKMEAFNSTINNSIAYGCNYRISPQSTDDNLFMALKKANFYKINIGLESGSERIRRDILNRNYSDKDFMGVASMIRKAGLKLFVFNIIGLPGETCDDYMKTVSLNRQCQPDGHYTGIFYPYPGTELYDVCVWKKLVTTTIDPRLERRYPVIDSPCFTKSQVKSAYVWFDYHVYRGFKPYWWIMLRTFMVKLRSNIHLNVLFRRIVQWPGLKYLREKLTKV